MLKIILSFYKMLILQMVQIVGAAFGKFSCHRLCPISLIHCTLEAPQTHPHGNYSRVACLVGGLGDNADRGAGLRGCKQGQEGGRAKRGPRQEGGNTKRGAGPRGGQGQEGTMAERAGTEGTRAVRGQDHEGASQGTGAEGGQGGKG